MRVPLPNPNSRRPAGTTPPSLLSGHQRREERAYDVQFYTRRALKCIQLSEPGYAAEDEDLNGAAIRGYFSARSMCLQLEKSARVLKMVPS